MRDIFNSIDEDVSRSLRHIGTRVHRVRFAIRDGLVHSGWCPAREMIADVLTKCLHADLFLSLRSSIVTTPCSGGRLTLPSA